MKTSILIFQSYLLYANAKSWYNTTVTLLESCPLDVSFPKTSIFLHSKRSHLLSSLYHLHSDLNFTNIYFSTSKAGFLIKIQKSQNQRQMNSSEPLHSAGNEESGLPNWQTHAPNYKKDVYSSYAEASSHFVC